MTTARDIDNHPDAAGWSGGAWPGDRQPIHGHPGPPDAACMRAMQAAEDAGRERARQYVAAMEAAGCGAYVPERVRRLAGGAR